MKEKRNNLIWALIFSILLVCSWMIAFYSGWMIIYEKPEWYHHAVVWGFGLLCFPICITCFFYWIRAFGIKSETETNENFSLFTFTDVD